MEKYHENNLQKNYVKLVNDMKAKPMTRYLYQMKIIDEDDKDEIFSKTTSQDMNEALLSALKKGGPEAFPEFIKRLQERQPSLACMLLKEDNDRLETELENVKIKTEELKTKLQRSESEVEELSNKCASLEEQLQLFQRTVQGTNMERSRSSPHRRESDQENIGVSQLEEIKIELDLAQSEKRELSFRCKKLETQTEVLKADLQLSNSEREGLLTKCDSLKERLKLLQKALRNPSFDQRKDSTTFAIEETEFQGPLSSRESSMINGSEELFDYSAGRQSRRQAQRTSRCQGSRASTRLGNELSQAKEYRFKYEYDFDCKGVIYYLGIRAGVSVWTNPAQVPESGVKVTFCGEDGRGDPESILQYSTPVNSHTRWGWCLDLGESYTLRLTDYTLRQVGSNERNYLRNFELLGRLYDEDEWILLDRHRQVDWRSQRFSHMMLGNKDLSYKTKTWSVEGEVKAFRYFKIVQMKGMSSVPGTQGMSLAGMEFYGVLSVLDSD